MNDTLIPVIVAIGAWKEAVHPRLDEADLPSAYANQSRYPAIGALFRSADLREGPLAFAQKRAPKWKGK